MAAFGKQASVDLSREQLTSVYLFCFTSNFRSVPQPRRAPQRAVPEPGRGLRCSQGLRSSWPLPSSRGTLLVASASFQHGYQGSWVSKFGLCPPSGHPLGF